MKSTPPSRRARRVAAKSFSGIQFANREDSIRLVLHKLQPPGRRKRKRPANQRKVDAVVAIFRAVVRRVWIIVAERFYHRGYSHSNGLPVVECAPVVRGRRA